jgi:hypothetical protein
VRVTRVGWVGSGAKDVSESASEAKGTGTLTFRAYWTAAWRLKETEHTMSDGAEAGGTTITLPKERVPFRSWTRERQPAGVCPGRKCPRTT